MFISCRGKKPKTLGILERFILSTNGFFGKNFQVKNSNSYVILCKSSRTDLLKITVLNDLMERKIIVEVRLSG